MIELQHNRLQFSFPDVGGLHDDPQDYVVSPRQPWLDGFGVTTGTIRQFVAMPLGRGYTAEEQITNEATYGDVQIAVYPMKREVFERRFPTIVRERVCATLMDEPGCAEFDNMSIESCAAPSLGLAPGGRMKQEIYDDPFEERAADG